LLFVALAWAVGSSTSSSPAHARTLLEIVPPEGGERLGAEDTWLIQGVLSFVPGVVTSADRFRIVEEPGGREVPLAVVGEVPYPDGSLMFVEVCFPLTLEQLQSKQYWLTAAPEGRSLHYEYDPRGRLPRLEFSLREVGEESGEPVESKRSETQPSLDMPVGELMVRIDHHPELYYYWYLIPIAGILALLIWRKVHLR